MDPIERKLRQFRAAFFVTPDFANWARTRGHELTKGGESFEIIMCWGRRRFRVGDLPLDDPHFAIEHGGTVERSIWCP
jgi:hypothetical protein